jgi:hypothetical protein
VNYKKLLTRFMFVHYASLAAAAAAAAVAFIILFMEHTRLLFGYCLEKQKS